MVKIAVLVSGGGTNLQALIDRQQAESLDVDRSAWSSVPGQASMPWSGQKKPVSSRW